MSAFQNHNLKRPAGLFFCSKVDLLPHLILFQKSIGKAFPLIETLSCFLVLLSYTIYYLNPCLNLFRLETIVFKLS